MRLGLNACILIVFMLIMGLVAAAPINSAVASYCYWDATAKKNVCGSDISIPTAPTATPYSYGYSSYSPYSNYYDPYYSSGYQYYSSIYTSLCGWQYNVYVNFDYNCANDYPAYYP